LVAAVAIGEISLLYRAPQRERGQWLVSEQATRRVGKTRASTYEARLVAGGDKHRDEPLYRFFDGQPLVIGQYEIAHAVMLDDVQFASGFIVSQNAVRNAAALKRVNETQDVHARARRSVGEKSLVIVSPLVGEFHEMPLRSDQGMRVESLALFT
jgi:hypothetical protein